MAHKNHFDFCCERSEHTRGLEGSEASEVRRTPPEAEDPGNLPSEKLKVGNDHEDPMCPGPGGAPRVLVIIPDLIIYLPA
ncbi:hypothetical protein GPJ56_007887 [Histomonas meleagridis]|nr:hypothetical protein GPJ56_007887 [Histomonas meleagridis]